MKRLELISAIALIAGGAAFSGCDQRTSAPGTAPDASAQGTRPNDTKVGEDVKHVQAGQQYMAFTPPSAPALTKGDYRAEVWVGDEKVNEQHFNVTDASKAAEVGKRPDRG